MSEMGGEKLDLYLPCPRAFICENICNRFLFRDLSIVKVHIVQHKIVCQKVRKSSRRYKKILHFYFFLIPRSLSKLLQQNRYIRAIDYLKDKFYWGGGCVMKSLFYLFFLQNIKIIPKQISSVSNLISADLVQTSSKVIHYWEHLGRTNKHYKFLQQNLVILLHYHWLFPLGICECK